MRRLFFVFFPTAHLQHLELLTALSQTSYTWAQPCGDYVKFSLLPWPFTSVLSWWLLLGLTGKMKSPVKCTWGLHKPHCNTWERSASEAVIKIQWIWFNSENLSSHFSVYCIISSWFSLRVHQLDIKDQCRHCYWAYQVSPMRWR